MINYLNLLAKIVNEGDNRMDRTGTGTRALFTEMLEWDLRHPSNGGPPHGGFPIVTTKEINFDLVKAELLWFISGSSNVADLQKLTSPPCRIWDANANDPKWIERAKKYGYGPGNLGRVYGVQWRQWRSYHMAAQPNGSGHTLPVFTPLTDQLADVIARIKVNPYDRRLIVTAWNPGELDQMALPPCHMFYQFFCGTDNSLSLTMYQRSCDTFLGVPFNISSYALLLAMVAQVVSRTAKTLKIVFGDVHIYNDHFEQVNAQLLRAPKALPKLVLNAERMDIDSFDMNDILLDGYTSHPAIKGKMSV